MGGEYFTQADLLKALKEPGVNGTRLAEALRVRTPSISEWKRGVENRTYTRDQLARAVLIAQGKAEPAEVDLSAGLLDQLEADARRMLERIRKAKGEALTPPTPSQVAAAVRASQKARKAK